MEIKFSTDLQTILRYARDEAARTGSYGVGADHVVLGLLRHRDNDACRILSACGVDLDAFKRDIDAQVLRDRAVPWQDQAQIRPTRGAAALVGGAAYEAKKILRKNNGLFEKLAADYGEADPDYPLFRNLPDKKKGIADKIAAFPEQTLTTSNGMETPTTFLIDLDGAETNFSVNGITQIFFNYSDFITGEINARTKGATLRDAWSYQGVFDPEYEAA